MRAIGIVPAAGTASRLTALRYPKELLPIGLERSDGEDFLRPRLVISSALEQLRYAGVECCHVIVSDQKWELLRYLSDGSAFGLPIGFLVQPEPRGLAHAIDCAYDWVRSPDVVSCLVLPDTVCTPRTALLELLELLTTDGADVALGVFPTSRPDRLGPVEMDPEGRVLRIQDKPAAPVRANTWGMACWTYRFTELLHRCVGMEEGGGELILGEVFGAALRDGLRVIARDFQEGGFYDLGTKEGITEFILHGAA